MQPQQPSSSQQTTSNSGLLPLPDAAAAPMPALPTTQGPYNQQSSYIQPQQQRNPYHQQRQQSQPQYQSRKRNYDDYSADQDQQQRWQVHPSYGAASSKQPRRSYQDSQVTRRAHTSGEQDEVQRGDERQTIADVSSICNLAVDPKDAILVRRARDNGTQQQNITTLEWNKLLLSAQCSEQTGDGYPQRTVTQSLVARNPMAAALLEIRRLHHLQLCRAKHKNLCLEVAGIAPPKESFNRWIFERRLHPRQMHDPLLPALFEPVVGPSLKREILEDMPIKVSMFPRDSSDAIRSIRQYVDAARRLLQQSDTPSATPRLRNLSRERRSAFCQALDTAEQHIASRQPQHLQKEDLLSLLKNLKQNLNELVTYIVEPCVDSTCTQLAQFADERHQQFMTQGNHVLSVVESGQTTTIVVQCREVRDGYTLGITDMSGKNHQVFVRKLHYRKLRQLFGLWQQRRRSFGGSPAALTAQSVTEESTFHARAFTLLRRYETFFGDGQFEGGGFQAAVPEKTFRVLHSLFEVSMECFASPMNCFFPQFCSAFEDTDVHFGSMGSFFDFHPVSGSFEANPPFTEEVMIQMVDHMEKLLAASDLPLSFIIFVPNWTDATSVQRMCQSQWLRKDFVQSAFAHRYINGLQHKPEGSKREYVAVHETHVFFLQNEAGFRKWTPSEQAVQILQGQM